MPYHARTYRSESRCDGPFGPLRGRRRWAAFAAGAVAVMLAGCGSKPTYEFDEQDLTPVQDELIEFSLGHYVIPIPVVQSYEENGAVTRNRIEFSFDLYALIMSDYESQFADLWERHQGKIRDRIIRVCRKASLEELQEEGLPTLKSHLMDAVQSQLGPKSIRRLLISEVKRQKL